MRNIQPIADLPYSVKPWIDITDDLPHRLPDSEPMRTLEDITHLSIHHSGVEGGTIRGYANYHVNDLKWHHIGYHNVIKADQLYQTNNWLTMSYHTSGNNDNTLSCSISGDLSKRPMSEVERVNLYAWALTCLAMFTNLTIENIKGHNEYPGNEKTVCPAMDMNQVRNDIKTLKMKLVQQNTWKAKVNKVSEIGNQYNFMIGKIAEGEESGDAKWGMSQLLSVYEIMKERKLL